MRARAIAGSRAALAVSEGYFQWRDGRSLESLGGSRRRRHVSQHGITPEAHLGTRIPELVEDRLDKGRWVYVWADGVYSGPRAEQTKLCALVVIGGNERGQKHFLAIEDGVRESTQSWREVLLKLTIGDGAMGFWAALDEVYPETRQQRCWMHKTMNALNCLLKSAQPKAKQALHNIWQAKTQADAEKAFNLLIRTYELKNPKAAACLHNDREELMAFYDFPAQHWQSIRTSNLFCKQNLKGENCVLWV